MSEIKEFLFPRNLRELSDYIADLTPLVGIYLFSHSLQAQVLPIFLSLNFLFVFGALRQLCYAVYWALKEVGILKWFQKKQTVNSKNQNVAPDFKNRLFLYGKRLLILLLVGPILLPLGMIPITAGFCMLGILIGSNFFLTMVLQWPLVLAMGLDGFSFLDYATNAPLSEKYYLLALGCLLLYRYAPGFFFFLKQGEFRNSSESYSWLLFGLPPVPDKNILEVYIHGFSEKFFNTLLIAIFPVFFGILILLVKAPMAGVVFLYLSKAVIEMNFARLYTKAK